MPLILLDVSGKWEDAGMAEWLADSVQSAWWVADNLPAKWTPRRQQCAADLHAVLIGNGIAAGWIANRDLRFPQRAEWLNCFPSAPVAKLPQLPAEMVVRAVWQGEGYPADALTDGATVRAFQRWAQAVIEIQGR